MNVLAFDTCLGAVSAAVRWKSAAGEWLLRDRFELRSSGHAERLMPMIAEVMDEAGLVFSDLDRLAVTVGPGTFTGVRAGVAAARALALASGLPVVGASSLAVMAHHAREQLGKAPTDMLAVAVDARRGMVYFQVFDPTQETTGHPSLVAPRDVAALFGTGAAVVVGSGARAVADAAATAGGRLEVYLQDLQPRTRSLALLAERLAPSEPLRPLYLRPPDVKPQVDQSLGRALPT